MLHGPGIRLSEDKSSKKKASLGLKMFFVYLIFYAGFTYVSITYPGIMGKHVFAGLNLAIVYGFGLIIIAILMGFAYHLICSKYEREMNKEEKL